MPCPQPQVLQQLLDETLPAEQQQPVQAHLESCAACQKTVERLAAGGVTWDKAAQNLGEKPSPSETALIDAVAKLQDTPTSAIDTSAETPSPPIDEDLTFLQPPQRPGSIGRLDEYEILGVVGKGGFGIVLKAFDENLHRVVAIKVMSPQMAASGTARQRFIRKAQAAAAITHENVVTIHAVKKDAKVPYLAMQFVSGQTLNEKIDRAGALSVKEILRIGVQTAEGLAAAHKQGLIHRDIKPANILLENGIERVKITDFGLARAVDDASLTQSGVVAGTPMYMSPEQAGGEPIDHRSDLFSLGSVLYVMCTGHPPFRASTTMAVLKRVCEETPTPVRQVNAEIPAWLADLIVKLHAKKPSERFQSAAEVAAILRESLADLQAGRMTATVPAAAPNPSATLAAPTPPGPMRKSRSLTPMVLIAVALCLCLGAPAIVVGLGALLWVGMARGPANDRDHPGPVAHDLKQLLGHKEQAAQLDVKPPEPGAWNGHFLKPFLDDPNGDPNAPDRRPKATDITDGKSNTVIAGQEQIMPSGWVQLFNAKDLTGWKMHPLNPGDWRVEDKAIVGRGNTSFLFSEKSDYANFHLRAEAKINATGDSGIVFRTPFGVSVSDKPTKFGIPGGYEAQIAVRSNYPIHTGSLMDGRAPILQHGPLTPHRPDEWFVLEVIAEGNHLQTWVNGKKAAEFYDEERRFARGHLALQTWGLNLTVVHFRKIEIKELPPAPVAAAQPNRYALQFANAGTLVRVEELQLHQLNDATVEVWVAALQDKYPVPAHVAGPTQQFSVFFDPNPKVNGWNLGLQFPDGFRHVGEPNPVSKGRLYHVAGVRQADQIHLFVDGKRIGSKKVPEGDLHENKNRELRIGSPGLQINAVRISKTARYDKDFAPQQRLAADKDTLALYQFDEGKGDVLTDSSGNRHHGKMFGAEWVKADGSPIPAYTNSLGMDFAFIPRGKFPHGGSGGIPGKEEVVIKHDFYLGVYEVTRDEWENLMGKDKNPSRFSRTGEFKDLIKDIPDEQLKRFAVDAVSWDDCQEFLKRLNAKTQEQGWIYRLPTSDEWEYACRGGPNQKPGDYAFDFYLDAPTNTLLFEKANFKDSGLKRPRPVGAYPPNRLGLFDMHGNVFELCHDVRVEGADRTCTLRGGCYNDSAEMCRARHFGAVAAAANFNGAGLRVARVPVSPP